MTAKFKYQPARIFAGDLTRLGGFLGMLLFCYTLSGCGLLKEPLKINPEATTLAQGEQAFFQKDYVAAKTLFSSILDTSQDSKTRNIALYDLACTQLIICKNKETCFSAITALKSWQGSKESNRHSENPLIFYLAIQTLLDIDQKDRVENLKKLQEVDATIMNQKEKIEQLEQMIKTLEHQILELENIDQEIQEKRNAN